MIIIQAESKPNFAAGLEGIVARDPFDQQLAAAFSPVLTPLLTYIGRTPALSNALVALAGQNTPLVSASWVKDLNLTCCRQTSQHVRNPSIHTLITPFFPQPTRACPW